jgi:hypothetical protein
MEEVSPMPEPQFAVVEDDLPRTFRREREAREREAREREARERALLEQPEPRAELAPLRYANNDDARPAGPASLARLDLPFFHLSWFFTKAMFAALPAVVILAVLLWLGGQALSIFFPQIVKMQILIHFPK